MNIAKLTMCRALCALLVIQAELQGKLDHVNIVKLLAVCLDAKPCLASPATPCFFFDIDSICCIFIRAAGGQADGEREKERKRERVCVRKRERVRERARARETEQRDRAERQRQRDRDRDR